MSLLLDVATSRRELGERARAMIEALAVISDDGDVLTRHYLSSAHARAVELVRSWMDAAGLHTSVDAAGTVHGLLGEGGRKRLLVGSHLDTVINAGRFDGTLGIVAGILAAEEMRRRGIDLPFDLEILAFGDEEGGRFPATLTGSSALAGCLDPRDLECEDDNGLSMAEALRAFGGDPERASGLAYDPATVIAYLEVHIEQGPILETVNRPLGIVTAIAGQSRFRIETVGEAGHAGTVPMDLRRDALAAAAEMVVAVEREAKRHAGAALVATVGEMDVRPGQSNVIPAVAGFSLDLRSVTDSSRERAWTALRAIFERIAERRRISLRIDQSMDKSVSACAPWLQKAIENGIAALEIPDAPRLMSGAGHDGHAMAHLTDIGMIFVRCEAGISHHPREFVLPDDMGLSVLALVETLSRLEGVGG